MRKWKSLRQQLPSTQTKLLIESNQDIPDTPISVGQHRVSANRGHG
jgi:hypothetical protein